MSYAGWCASPKSLAIPQGLAAGPLTYPRHCLRCAERFISVRPEHRYCPGCRGQEIEIADGSEFFAADGAWAGRRGSEGQQE